jgi:hypothetical protein
LVGSAPSIFHLSIIIYQQRAFSPAFGLLSLPTAPARRARRRPGEKMARRKKETSHITDLTLITHAHRTSQIHTRHHHHRRHTKSSCWCCCKTTHFHLFHCNQLQHKLSFTLRPLFNNRRNYVSLEEQTAKDRKRSL